MAVVGDAESIVGKTGGVNAGKGKRKRRSFQVLRQDVVQAPNHTVMQLVRTFPMGPL